MKAEATLQFMADFYKSIFPTRKHALNQLFCVNGNGMEWENGELCFKDGNPYMKRYKMIEEIEKAEFPNEDNWNETHDTLLDLALLDDKDKSSLPIEYQFEWYPLCQYSKIFTYPDDIKPDWMELINECKKLMEQDGIYVDMRKYRMTVKTNSRKGVTENGFKYTACSCEAMAIDD